MQAEAPFAHPHLMGHVPACRRGAGADGTADAGCDDASAACADDDIVVTTDAPLRGVAPGQAAVFYDTENNVCLGGGTIQRTGPTLADTAV